MTARGARKTCVLQNESLVCEGQLTRYRRLCDVGDYSPVKRRSRQFTPEQTEAIAALQKVADASIVPTCTLGRGKANIFLDGNPIVYGGAVETVTMAPATGDPVIVVDHVGKDVHSHHSLSLKSSVFIIHDQ